VCRASDLALIVWMTELVLMYKKFNLELECNL